MTDATGNRCELMPRYIWAPTPRWIRPLAHPSLEHWEEGRRSYVAVTCGRSQGCQEGFGSVHMGFRVLWDAQD